mgnify:CR=1 FL=1
MGSTRYPGKVLEILKGEKRVLDYVINQLSFSKSIKNVIIATTTLEQDNVIVKYAKDNNLEYFRGEPLNVLDRYYQCAKEFSLETIVRNITSNPRYGPLPTMEIQPEFREIPPPNNLRRTILLPFRFNHLPIHMNNIYPQEPYDPDLQEAIRRSLED